MERISKMWRSGVALVLAICMVIGVLPATAFAAEETINYVSLGDSMTNGYGFVGYNQSSNDRSEYDPMTGKGMYGEGAYPLQFEEYLSGLGYNVNHSKLAISGMLPEDVLYLLGGREAFDNGWSGYRSYDGNYSEADLMPYFQKSIAEADVMTLCLGNASFGAFLMDRVMTMMGVFSGDLSEEEKLDLDDALTVLDLSDEEYAMIMDLYSKLDGKMSGLLPEDLAATIDTEVMVDLLAYCAATFIINYRLLIEHIMTVNPDVEIVLVGLLNTTFGLNMTDDAGNVVIPFGDMTDLLFNVLNVYIAGLPAVLQSQGEYPEAKLYFAAQPQPKYVCQAFEEMLDSGWQDAQGGRLSAKIVRERTIEAYNSRIARAMGAALNEGTPLAKINLEDVQAYEAIDLEALKNEVEGKGETFDPWQTFLYTGRYADPTTAADKVCSVVGYLALEEAVARNINKADVTMAGLMSIASGLDTIFLAMGEPDTASPEAVRQWLYNGLQSSENNQGMCKIYGLFQVGNGMGAHPSPAGHDDIAQSVISSYKNNTVADQTQENVKYFLQVYGPEIAGYAMKLWADRENNGLGNQQFTGLVLDSDSTYVALGDGTVAPKGYAEALAAQLTEKCGIQNFVNYAESGNTVGSELEKIASYAELTDADLITIGFGNITMLSKAFENAMYGDGMVYDWAGLVGEDKLSYVELGLNEVYGMTAGMGLDADTTSMVNSVIEGVAYGAVEYMLKLPELVAAIREVNADANIVIVGQYNPMEGVALKLGSASMEFADYIDYFVEIVALHGTAYCAISHEAIFVEAPAVETVNSDMEWTIADLAKMLIRGFANLNPSDAGHAYIAGEIMEALNLDEAKEPEAPEVPEDPTEPEVPEVPENPAPEQLGDANGDGKLNLRDAILALQAANGKDVAVDNSAADVTGDGKVNIRDAILILKRANGNTDPFPAEK